MRPTRPTGIRREEVEKGKKTQELPNRVGGVTLKVKEGVFSNASFKPTKKEPKYKFAPERFSMTEKASYVNEKSGGERSTVRIIIGQPGNVIYNDAWEKKEVTDKILEHTYNNKYTVNNLVEIYQDEIDEDTGKTSAKEIGNCYFNQTTGVYVSQMLNPDGYKDLTEILEKRGRLTEQNLAPNIEQCPWLPKCSESKGRYYWVNIEDPKKILWKEPEHKECQTPREKCPPDCNWTEQCTGEPGKSHWVKEGETPVPETPLGCRKQKEINNLQCGPSFASNLEKGSCPWTPVCSSEYNKPYWVHSDGRTTQWIKPSCVAENWETTLGDPCKSQKKGGRRKTRKNKKSKRKTKSRR